MPILLDIRNDLTVAQQIQQMKEQLEMYLNGLNDKGSFLHIKYSANANGMGMKDKPDSSTVYMGVLVNDSQLASPNATDYQWVKVKGEQGGGGSGSGDMTKAVYDKNGDGIVDNASALGGHNAAEFAKVEQIPTVPTKVSAFTNDVGYLTEHQSLANYVKTTDSRLSDARTPKAHTHTTSEVTGLGDALDSKQNTLISGSNIKTINNQSLLGSGNINIQGGGSSYDDTELRQLISEKANTSDLSNVATSGSYNDLSDKPSIPTVPTAEINANTQARHTHSNKAILDGIIKAPITEHQSLDGYATESWVGNQGYLKSYTESDPTVPSHVKAIKNSDISNWNSKAEVSDIPTSTSELTNDSGFLTEHQSLKTINNQSIVGTGNITISGGGGVTLDEVKTELNGTVFTQSSPDLSTANATWTAPANGILSGVLVGGSATRYWYLRDTTDGNKIVLRLYTTTNTQQMSGACGVCKGHKYTVQQVSISGATLVLNFVPISY